MEENSHQVNLTSTTEKLGLRGSSPLPTIHKNGVAERKIRFIMEFVKSMVHDQDLPMYMWEEAVEHRYMCPWE